MLSLLAAPRRAANALSARCASGLMGLLTPPPSAPRGAANAFAACRASWGYRCPHPPCLGPCGAANAIVCRASALVGLPIPSSAAPHGAANAFAACRASWGYRRSHPPRLVTRGAAGALTCRALWGCGCTTTCNNEHRHEPQHDRACTPPLEVSTQVPPHVAP